MMISELINRLKTIKDANGDMAVVVDDADTGWLFRVNECDLNIERDEKGTRLEIGVSYGGEEF